MRYEEFISSCQPRWERLRSLSERIQKKGYSSLTSEELDSFLLWYRQTSADLAYVRTHFPDTAVEAYLNNVVAHAHAQLSRVRPGSFRRVLLFYTHTFPQLFAKHAKFIGLAVCIFVGSGIISGLGVQYDRQFFMGISPIPESVLEERVSRGSVGPDMDQFIAPISSSYIFVNNVQVGIMTYGTGIFLGLGTLFYLAINGIMLGVVTAFFAGHGMGIELLANILPHGILELTAIFICGGAGLLLGESVVNPGELPRSQSIGIKGREATQLVAGSVLLLAISGVIEGYFSFVETISIQVKLGFCVVPGVFLYVYLLRHLR
ncbi:MAG: stage II sporulation protein M [Candidatus Methanofastidiosia archaeon]|jgi:uncharacterized membrane protein SpoIIM required for sporulation